MKNRYFIIFIVFALLFFTIYCFFKFLPKSNSYLSNPRKQELHTVCTDGIWKVCNPDNAAQFNADIQNMGWFPGNGIRNISQDYVYDDSGYLKDPDLIYRIKNGGGIRTIPLVNEDVIYFISTNGCFYAYDIYSNEEKWIFEVPEYDREHPYSKKAEDHYLLTYPEVSHYNYGMLIFSSPAIYRDTIYFGDRTGYVYALDKTNGDIKWKTEIPGPHFSSPKIYKDALYIGSIDGNLYKLDVKTGEMIWQFKTNAYIISSAAIYEDIVYINSQDSCLYALSIDGEHIWTNKMEHSTYRSPVIYEGIILIGDRKLYAFDCRTGKQIWDAGPYEHISPCAVIRGRVFFSGDDYFYSLNAKDGSLDWELQIEYEGYNIPVNIVQVIATEDLIHAININSTSENHQFGSVDAISIENGEVISFLNSNNFFNSPVAISDEILYFCSRSNDPNDHYSIFKVAGEQAKYRWNLPVYEKSKFLNLCYNFNIIGSKLESNSSYVLSKNRIVLYEMFNKLSKKETEASYFKTDIIMNHIITFDINTGEKISYVKGELGKSTDDGWFLTLFKRSLVLYNDILLVERGMIRESYNNSNKIPQLPGIMNNYYCAVNISTGDELWRYDLGNQVFNSPPLINKDKIYIGSVCDNEIACSNDADSMFTSINLMNGQKEWQINITGNVYSKPIVYNNMLYFTTDQGFLYAVDTADGGISWKFSADGGINTSPAVYGDIVYFGTWNYSIYAVDAYSGKGRWIYKTPGRILKNLYIEDNMMYFSSHTESGGFAVHCLDLQSGIELFVLQDYLWHHASPFSTPKRPYYLQFIINSGLLFIGTDMPVMSEQFWKEEKKRWEWLHVWDVKTCDFLWGREFGLTDAVMEMYNNALYIYSTGGTSEDSVFLTAIDKKTGNTIYKLESNCFEIAFPDITNNSNR